jgi:Rrf2 family protein
MLSLSKKTDYALLLLTMLAQKPEEYFSIKKLALEKKMPYRFLAQIANTLTSGGILKSREGVGGGYRLAKKAKKITVHDVVSVVEGGVALATCLSKRNSACVRSEGCPLKSGMPMVQKMVLQTLAKKNIADLIAENK